MHRRHRGTREFFDNLPDKWECHRCCRLGIQRRRHPAYAFPVGATADEERTIIVVYECCPHADGSGLVHVVWRRTRERQLSAEETLRLGTFDRAGPDVQACVLEEIKPLFEQEISLE